MVVAEFPVLTGTPIAGALLSTHFIWWRPFVFSGVSLQLYCFSQIQLIDCVILDLFDDWLCLVACQPCFPCRQERHPKSMMCYGSSHGDPGVVVLFIVPMLVHICFRGLTLLPYSIDGAIRMILLTASCRICLPSIPCCKLEMTLKWSLLPVN